MGTLGATNSITGRRIGNMVQCGLVILAYGNARLYGQNRVSGSELVNRQHGIDFFLIHGFDTAMDDAAGVIHQKLEPA